MGSPQHAGQRGIAMVIVLLSLLVVTVLGFALTASGLHHLAQAFYMRQKTEAFYAAQAGIARELYSLGQTPNPPTLDLTGILVNNTSFQVQVTNNLFGAAAVSGRVVASVPPGYAELVSTGTSGTTTKRVVVVATRNAFNPFMWAAFGDTGVALDSGSGSGSCNSAMGNCNPSCPGSNGNVGSNGTITLDSGVTVDGSLSAQGTVTPYPIHPPTIVTGTVTQGAPHVDLPAVDTSYRTPNANGSIGGTGWYWSPPGSRNLFITNTGVAIFPAGTYYLDSVHIDSSGQLQVPVTLGSSEKVTINLTGTFHADSGSRVNNLTEVAGKLLIATSATDPTPGSPPSASNNVVYLDSGSGFYGAIYAPNGSIRLDAGAQNYGSMVAKRLSWDSGSQFCYDVQLGNASLGSGQGMLTKSWAGE